MKKILKALPLIFSLAVAACGHKTDGPPECEVKSPTVSQEKNTYTGLCNTGTEIAANFAGHSPMNEKDLRNLVDQYANGEILLFSDSNPSLGQAQKALRFVQGHKIVNEIPLDTPKLPPKTFKPDDLNAGAIGGAFMPR